MAKHEPAANCLHCNPEHVPQGAPLITRPVPVCPRCGRKYTPWSTEVRHVQEDRLSGMWFGLAIGDALGAAVEFANPGSFEPVTEFRDGGPHGLAAGEWTDDTSMALALADSLVSVGGFDAGDLMQRFVEWFDGGKYSVNGKCFDCGNTIAAALWRFKVEGESYAGSTHENTAGNGGIMRMAPAIVASRNDEHVATLIASGQSQTTHRHDATIDAARVMATLLWNWCNGMSREEGVLNVRRRVTELCLMEHPEVMRIASDPLGIDSPPEPTGYVVNTLEASLWAISSTTNFEEAVLAAVNLGGDADTIGAVTGQLAGALYGYHSIPKHLIRGLAKKMQLMDAFEALWKCKVLPLEMRPPAELEHHFSN